MLKKIFYRRHGIHLAGLSFFVAFFFTREGRTVAVFVVARFNAVTLTLTTLLRFFADTFFTLRVGTSFFFALVFFTVFVAPTEPNETKILLRILSTGPVPMT